jgi:hypothetical protein
MVINVQETLSVRNQIVTIYFASKWGGTISYRHNPALSPKSTQCNLGS